MFYKKTLRNQYVDYVEYTVGEAESLTISLKFKFPLELSESLTPLSSSVNLYDSKYKSLKFITKTIVDINNLTIDLDSDEETRYHLFFQTNFKLIDSNLTRDKLEELLKKSSSEYTIKGGQSGNKNYLLFDSIAVSEDKLELFMFKQIELKR